MKNRLPPPPYPSTAQMRSIFGSIWQSIWRTAARIVQWAALTIPVDAFNFPLIEYSEEEYGKFFWIKNPRGTFKKYYSAIVNAEIYLEDQDTGVASTCKLCDICELDLSWQILRIRFTPQMAPYFLQCNFQYYVEQHAFHEHVPEDNPLFPMINPFHIEGWLDVSYVRLYALIRKYRGVVEFPIERLRTLLELGEKYSKPSHFFGTYLLAAQRSFDEHCDVSFTFAAIKHGRKFDRVRFEVHVCEPLKWHVIWTYFLKLPAWYTPNFT